MARDTTQDFIRIPSASRFKDTGLFVGDAGFEFGLLEPPDEADLAVDGDRFHRVQSTDVGSLDSIAILYYGKGYEYLWWFLAVANRLIDPERDMFLGQELRIPARTKALAFVNRGGRV